MIETDVAVDTFFAGTLKGVGRVYIQTVLDCFSRYVWARLYTSKMPVTAVQILNNHVLLFFEEHRVKVETILSDNGREFCGREDQHPDELFLQLDEIEHRKTKVGRPQSNGFIGRFHRTLLDEHLRVKGRTTWYESVDEMQADLDAYLETYNRNRPHRGRGMEGRTPYQVFKKGIRKPRSRKKSAGKEMKAAAASADLGEAGGQVITVPVHSVFSFISTTPSSYYLVDTSLHRNNQLQVDSDAEAESAPSSCLAKPVALPEPAELPFD